MDVKKLVLKNGIYLGGFCFIAIVISFAIYDAVQLLLMSVGVGPEIAEGIGRLSASIVIVMAYYRLFGIDGFGMRRADFFRGLATGGFLFFVVIMNFSMSIMEEQENPMVKPPVSLILMVVVGQLLVGVFEEFLFRGFLLNVLLMEREDGKSMGKMAAVVASSVLFGLVHFINLSEVPQMINFTVSQVCYAIFIGIYLGVLYLRVNNIWVVVVCHAAINLAGDLPEIFFEPSAGTGVPADISLDSMMVNILFNFVFVIAALFIARKRKVAS